METAFSDIHSGAHPTTGSWEICRPASFASVAARTSIREISTQDPMWSTGGMSANSQTLFRPSPHTSFALLSIRPAFAAAWAEHPEAITIISFASIFFINSIWAKSGRTFGLLHPTIATAPRSTPDVIHCNNGFVVPVSSTCEFVTDSLID